MKGRGGRNNRYKESSLLKTTEEVARFISCDSGTNTKDEFSSAREFHLCLDWSNYLPEVGSNCSMESRFPFISRSAMESGFS